GGEGRVQLDLEGVRWHGPEREEVRVLLTELEMRSLLRELGGAGEPPAIAYEESATAAAVATALGRLRAATSVAIVADVDSARATTARLQRVALAAGSGPGGVVPGPEASGGEPGRAPVLPGPALGEDGAR